MDLTPVVDPIEVMFERIPAMFTLMVKSFGAMFAWLWYSPNDIMAMVGIPEWIQNLLGKVTIPVFLDMPIVMLMLGAGLLVYILYQFVTWLLNLVT